MKRYFYPSYKTTYINVNYEKESLGDLDDATGEAYEGAIQFESSDSFVGIGNLEDHVSPDNHTWAKIDGQLVLDGSGAIDIPTPGSNRYLYSDPDVAAVGSLPQFIQEIEIEWSQVENQGGAVSIHVFTYPPTPNLGVKATVAYNQWTEGGPYTWRADISCTSNQWPYSWGTTVDIAGPPTRMKLDWSNLDLYLDDVLVVNSSGGMSTSSLSRGGVGIDGNFKIKSYSAIVGPPPHYAYGTWTVDIGPSTDRIFYDSFTGSNGALVRNHDPDYDPEWNGWDLDYYSARMQEIQSNRCVGSLETWRGVTLDSMGICGGNWANTQKISGTIGVISLPEDLLTSVILGANYYWAPYAFYGARWRYEPSDQTGHWDIVLATLVDTTWQYDILATTPEDLAPGDTRSVVFTASLNAQSLTVAGVEILTATDSTITQLDGLYAVLAFQNCSPTQGLYVEDFEVGDTSVELSDPISTITATLKHAGTADPAKPFILEYSEDTNNWTEPAGLEYPTIDTYEEPTLVEISIDLPDAPRSERYWRISYGVKDETPYGVTYAGVQELLSTAPPIPPVPAVYEDCGAFLGVRECEIRVYDSLGKRKLLGVEDWAESVDWEILERGGCGSGTLKLKAGWDEAQFSGNERVDVYLFDQLAYRGYVRVSENDIAEEETATINMYGLMELLEHWFVYRKFAYGAPTDISVIFQDILSHAVTVTDRLEWTVVQVETIGCYVTEFDAVGKSVTQAINQLCDLAPNQVIWGAELNSTANWRGYRENLLYMRVRNETLTHAYALGRNVTGYTYPIDIGEVVNRIRLTGGKVAQPNLMPNGSFESLKPADEEVGNFLTMHSFEQDDLDPWVGSGGVTVQHPGEGGQFGSGRTGDHWLEIDQNGESAYQDVWIPEGLDVTAFVWARQEQHYNSNSFVLELVGYDSDGAIVSDLTQGYTLDNNDTRYRKYSIASGWWLGDHIIKARIKVIAQGGSANNDGILIDDCAIIPTNGVGQENWRYHTTGNAVTEALSWNWSTNPRSGGLCVSVTLNSISTRSDTGEFYMYQSKSPSVKPNERYTMIVSWRIGGINLGNGGDTSITFGCVDIHSDNTQHTVTERGDCIGNNTDWYTDYLEIITDSDTVKLQPFIRVRTNRTVIIDDVMLVQGEPPDEVMFNRSFWTGEEYEAVIDVTDPAITGLSADALTSIDDYGIREAIVTQEGVTDRASLLTYARDYFNAHAVPSVTGKLSVLGPTELLEMNGLVRLIGIADGPNDLFPSRIRYSVSDTIKLEADLGSERPDMADLLFIIKERAERGY